MTYVREGDEVERFQRAAAVAVVWLLDRDPAAAAELDIGAASRTAWVTTRIRSVAT